MKNQFKTTKLFRACLLSYLVAVAACSYSTTFVVSNASNNPIVVRYRLKKPLNSLAPSRLPEVPSVKTISELDRQIAWRELPTSRFTFDPNTRTAVVSLMPGEALRVYQLKLDDDPENNVDQAANFPVEEINIKGNNGEVNFEGEQARRSFVPASKTLYVLTYY